MRLPASMNFQRLRSKKSLITQESKPAIRLSADAGLANNQLFADQWAQRASAELGAAQRFKHIHTRLESQAAHSSILSLVSEAAADEENHAFLCAKTAKNMGHHTGFKKATANSISPKPSWHTLNETRKLTLDVILMSCIIESINANLMNTIFANSKGHSINQLIRKILKDEIKHGKIGWAYLTIEGERQDLSFVTEHLEEMLDIAVHDELFQETHSNNESSFEFGILPEKDRLEQFIDSLENIVEPGFTHFGIDSSPITRWLTRKISSQSDAPVSISK